MVDDEGTLSTTDVKARFVNGKPQAIEARYNMRSQFEWDRFIRFMDRCGQIQTFALGQPRPSLNAGEHIIQSSGTAYQGWITRIH